MMFPAARPRALVLLSLLAASPARAGGFKCPEAGGPPWRELRTAHFVVQTDMSSGKAKDLAEELERVHETVRFGLFRTPPETGVIRVLALAEEEEFDLFCPFEKREFVAFYAQPRFSGPTIVLYGKGADAMRSIVAHEITHHVAARVFARRPPWFNEGLACLMESVATVGTPTIGGISPERLRAVSPYFGEVARVLRARDHLENAQDYGVAWALVHYLMNERPQEFGQLQQRFARGQEPAAAWREVFPKWDPASDEAMATLDKEVGRYVNHGRHRERDVKLRPAQPPSERPMTAAEAHDVRLSLPWPNRGQKVPPEIRQAEVEEALRHDPGSVQALALTIDRKSTDAVTLAEKATAAHPEDARAWILFASVLPPEAKDRREAALHKAVDLLPSSALALNQLAWHLLGAGRAEEALPLAQRAARLDPGSAAVLDTLAGIGEALGSCASALEVQRRAVEILPERLSAKGRAPYLERLQRLEKCAAARPAAPPAPAPGAE